MDSGRFRAIPEAAKALARWRRRSHPFANVETVYFDGNGGLTGALVVSSNGSSSAATETGTYTVNSDCPGTYTVQIAPFGITSQAFFAIDTNGDELEIIVTDPGSVITCVAKKLFPGRAI